MKRIDPEALEGLLEKVGIGGDIARVLRDANNGVEKKEDTAPQTFPRGHGTLDADVPRVEPGL